ncbi:MAG: ABC transporter ATP-binding protein [Brevinematia bacterium]
MLILLDKISKWYIEEDGSRFVVFNDFSLAIDKGEFVSVVGESGSGKTTLLNIIGGIDDVNQGRVLVNDIDITSLDEEHLADFRNLKVGYVFQNHFLLRGFTVIENVIIPAMMRRDFRKDYYLGKAKELLSYLGLGDKLDRLIDEISGGEKQRVSIARALINDPEFLIADEPTGNLDPKNSEIVFSLFFSLVKELGKTCVMATHDISLAEKCDRIIRLS